VALAVLVLVVAGGIVAWRDHQLSERRAQSMRYSSALSLVREGKDAEAAKVFAVIAPEGGGYATLAAFEEAELLAWASTAIDEPAARPKRIYPMTEFPVTAVGKPFKPALLADAAVRAITEALTAAGVADARVTAAHEDGRLVVTVTGADPDRVQDAVAGFALTVRCGPPPAAQTTSK
jgi:hypothetical protein